MNVTLESGVQMRELHPVPAVNVAFIVAIAERRT
jgi:hypothetical protein